MIELTKKYFVRSAPGKNKIDLKKKYVRDKFLEALSIYMWEKYKTEDVKEIYEHLENHLIAREKFENNIFTNPDHIIEMLRTKKMPHLVFADLLGYSLSIDDLKTFFDNKEPRLDIERAPSQDDYEISR